MDDTINKSALVYARKIEKFDEFGIYTDDNGRFIAVDKSFDTIEVRFKKTEKCYIYQTEENIDRITWNKEGAYQNNKIGEVVETFKPRVYRVQLFKGDVYEKESN